MAIKMFMICPLLIDYLSVIGLKYIALIITTRINHLSDPQSGCNIQLRSSLELRERAQFPILWTDRDVSYQNSVHFSCFISIKMLYWKGVILVLTGVNKLHQDQLLHVLMENFFQCSTPFFLQPSPEFLGNSKTNHRNYYWAFRFLTS